MVKLFMKGIMNGTDRSENQIMLLSRNGGNDYERFFIRTRCMGKRS